MRTTIGLFLLFMFIMPSLVVAGMPPGSMVGASKQVLILLHDRDRHSTWLVVDLLRKGAHQKPGFHTLSLQMPNEDRHWKEYVDASGTAACQSESCQVQEQRWLFPVLSQDRCRGHDSGAGYLGWRG